MNIKSFLWIAPFICFFSAYFLASLLIGQQTVSTPTLLGSSITDALKILTQHTLQAQLLHQKVDDDIPDGTVLSQTPSPGSSIKHHQTVYLTVSKKSSLMNCPHYIGLYKESIQEEAKKDGILVTYYPITHPTPAGICVAQHPQPDKKLHQKKVICYYSSGPESLYIMPSLKGQSLESVANILGLMNLAFTVVNLANVEHSNYNQHTVLNQKPLAGTIISLAQPITIQLIVSEEYF